MAFIDTRVNEGFERMFNTFMRPLHEENKKDNRELKTTLEKLLEFMHRTQGGVSVAKPVADRVLAGIGAVSLLILAAIIGPFWK